MLRTKGAQIRVLSKGSITVVDHIGTIDKVRQHFFAIFDIPPCPLCQHFLYLSVSTFSSIFDPSPPKKVIQWIN